MSHFMAIAAPALLLAATSAMANELPSRQFPEKSAIESSTRPGSDLAPVRIAQRTKDGAAAKKSAAATPPATADVKTADGKDVGTVTLTQTRAGVRLSGTLKGLPPGERALHVHSVGKCEPPFTSAGPHFNPAQKKHGKLNPEGHHAGDMDNITVPANGNLSAQDREQGHHPGKGQAQLRVSGGWHRRGGPRRQGRLHDRPNRQCRRSHRLRRHQVSVRALRGAPEVGRSSGSDATVGEIRPIVRV